MEKSKKKLQVLAIVVGAVALLIGSNFEFVAAQVGYEAPPAVSADDALKLSLAKHLENSPSDEIALLVAQILVGEKEQMVGLSFTSNEMIGQNTCLKDGDSRRCVIEGWEEIDLPTNATNTKSEQNLLGVNYIIDYAEMEFKGTISSTFAVSVGTSTSQYGPVSNASSTNVLYPKGIIARTIIPSSARNVEFNVGYENIVVATSTINVGASSRSTGMRWEVPTSTFLSIFVQDASDAGQSNGICAAEGVTCEAVTSSNRGTWTGKLRYHYHYTKDF